MKQLLSRKLSVWKSSMIVAYVTAARYCLHLESLQRAHAQLHLSKNVYPLKKTLRCRKTGNSLS